jgi:hypothetical protein
MAPDQIGRGYYFLWSLERVAVAFNLDTIGRKDWYGWGAEILIANQAADGSWAGEFAGAPDTCFALLFLRRSNLARDLTASLRGQLKDPGAIELKGGGVGGASVEPPRLKSAFGPSEKSSREPAVKPVTPPTPPRAEDAVTRLSDELLQAPAARQDQVLAKLRDTPGGEHTQALVLAIPKLTGEARTRARDALAERLTRMKASTLEAYLENEDLELRRAAALACAMKDERGQVPRLIELLDDPEPPVARAAYAALKSLTGQDFGPAIDATRAERAKAVADWKAWWARQEDR